MGVMKPKKAPPTPVDPMIEQERLRSEQEQRNAIQDKLKGTTDFLLRKYGSKRAMAGASGSPAIMSGL
jgi:hypothetical protein